MQQQTRPVAQQPQAPQPAPIGMQPLTAAELRAVVGGPVIQNGGGVPGVATSDSTN